MKSVKPYYESQSGVLYNGKAEEILPAFDSESVDLIITDPPYNIGDKDKLTKKGNKLVSTEEAWGKEFKDSYDFERYVEWIVELSKEFYRILKKTGSLILFLDRNYSGYFAYLIEKNTGFKLRNKIYFEKLNPLPHIRKNNYRSCIEEALWFTKGKTYYLNFISQDKMLQVFKGFIGKKKTSHPTEKYMWMIEPLITRHSKPGDIVLDPFFGSGTVGEVCELNGRRWIGVEKEEKFCLMAKRRIEKISKLTLFLNKK
ncbi:site-specific DNA-methyltransferase [Desulfurobacterium sp.]|uniref:DNA-methyltransferase n=1 Tax=Desulfurobacterium sp. TaxID=2004706 RepID=UPI002614303A|nr:site-specific DNA-methyltransferase [Desulfurobacterium sp.]